MRLFVIVFTFIVLTQCIECRHTGWFPQNLVDTFTDKTSQIANYVKEKGRSIKQFYVRNRNKLTSYFSSNNTNDEEVSFNGQDRDTNFETYVEDAQANEKKVFDAIAPEDIEYQCNDDDPSVGMTTPQLIAANGYNAESHSIITEDGYILTIHRIPYSKLASTKVPNRRTVLLHHGLLGSSADWIIAGREKGLGYILSDAGYDVWLANVRGNTYSRAHVTHNPDSFAFWNFTFHEVSQYDLPAVIDYIMEVKDCDVKINYIGHSMGTTILFSLLSTKTQYNKVLRAGFALAPVAYMREIKSPIRLLAKFSNNLEYLLELLGANEFLPQNSVLRWLSKHACEINHYEEAICENSLFILCGHDERQFNRSLLPIILGHVPAGASSKTLVHYAQEIKNDGKFQQFDYGPKGNILQYGTTVPPEYKLHKITLPIALLSAQNDWLAGEVDVIKLYQELANPIEHYVVPLKEFNHIDFLWAVDAPKLVYKKLLELLGEGESNAEDDNRIDVDMVK